jgi:hypothetical protein
LVLDEWVEMVPTDGVHIEPTLSTGVSTDEARASALRAELEATDAQRQLRLAEAEAARTIALRENISATVNLGSD